MQVSVERTGPCEARISFTVPRAEFEGELRQQLRSASHNVRMKGFRPGKVPPKLLEKHFGPEARRRALERFFERAFDQAVREEKLDTVGHQRVSLEEIELPEGADLSQSFEVSLRPSVELVTYKGLRIESELEPVLDQEVEAALADLRRQLSRPEPAGEAGLDEAGMALCKVSWVKEGETLFEREGLRLSPLDQVPGITPEAWREAVLGRRKGETVEIPMRLPDDFDRAELRGSEAITRLEIQEAYRMIPPGDEEVHKLMGAESPEQLLDKCRERLREAKESRERVRIESALLERLLGEQTMDLPARMVASQIEIRSHNLARELEEQGATPEEAKAEVERQAEDIRGMVERGLRALFLVQAIARAENMRVESQDLVQELREIAARNQATYEEVRDYYREKGLIEQVGIELLERRVRAFLRENAEVVQPS